MNAYLLDLIGDSAFCGFQTIQYHTPYPTPNTLPACAKSDNNKQQDTSDEAWKSIERTRAKQNSDATTS